MTSTSPAAPIIRDSSGAPRSAPLMRSAKNYFNIIYAIMMHDIKNRYFGSGIGQIAMVIWPFIHIIVLLAVYIFTKRPTPYGNSLLLYSAASVFPFICYSYTMRWIVFSAMTNRSFLQYAIIKPLDLLIARAALEVVSITIVAILLVVFLLCVGVDPMPYDHAQAVYAMCAVLFLSIGFGICNAAIAFCFPIWNMIVLLSILLAYLSSGVLFVVSKMPEQIRVPLSYNPVLQCVEWMRTAYYMDYPTDVLDRTYVLEFSLCSLAIGLVLLRLLQRFY